MEQQKRPPVIPDHERIKLILEAAERVFAVFGYGDATMEEIARDCGMAKKTLYRLFPDKDSVFSALVDSHDIPSLTWCGEAKSGDAADRVKALLLDIAEFILTPRQLLLTRLVISESCKHPELAARFHEECIDKTERFVAEQLAHLAPLGVEPRLMADILLGATIGSVQIRALIHSSEPTALNAEIRRHVQGVIDVFIAPLLSPA